MKTDFTTIADIVHRIIYLILTLSLSIYWISIFSRNEDLVTIDHTKYYAREENVYPELSLCLANSISEKKLAKLYPNISEQFYKQFLRGETFDYKFPDIDYQSIIENMTDYIEEDFLRYRNGSGLAFHPDYKDYEFRNEWKYEYGKNYQPKQTYPSKYSFFSDNEAFFNCYKLSIPPEKSIKSFWFRIDTRIFPSRVRPKGYGFLTILHYPNQLLISKTLKHLWANSWNKEEIHEMVFHVSGVEVLRRRQKWRRPCHNHWKDYDDYIIEKNIN